MKIRQRHFSSLEDAQHAFALLGCDEAGIQIMKEKAFFHSLELQEISLRAAIILKQEMMALGGEVVLSRDVMTLQPEKTTAIILGTEKQYAKLWQKLAQQPFGCKEIANLLKKFLEEKKQPVLKQQWQFENKTLSFEKPLIMGIINITPDSFSDGGKYLHTEAAVQHAKQLIKEGADIIDLGAESTKPGSDAVTEEEELKRLLPVLDALLKDQEVQVPISIDTYKPCVAEECLKRGAHILNDITGMQNPKMREVAAQYRVPVIIMHMQGTPKTMQENPQYKAVVAEIIDFLEQQINVCKAEGITQIICDPGIGFGKTSEHNLELLKRLKEFEVLAVPLLIGTSRKSFIGKTVGGEVDDRLEGTIASNVVAMMHGANIFRVHDVKACRRALDLTAAIFGSRKYKAFSRFR